MVSLLKFSSHEQGNKSLRPPEYVSAPGICISWIRIPLLFRCCHGRWSDGLSLIWEYGPPQNVNHDIFLPPLYLFVSVYTHVTVNMTGGPDTQ